jgi:homoserine O-acetyltransferase
MQKDFPTRDQADAFLDSFVQRELDKIDANDTLYAFDASRTYDPEAKLTQIKAHVMFINS